MKDDYAITDQQRLVIDHLLAGKTKTEAAQLVQVDRVTVWRWEQEPGYLAELNQRRAEIWEAQTERLRAMAARAVDVVEAALNSEDERISLDAAKSLLKVLNLADLQPRGQTSAAAIANPFGWESFGLE